MKPVRVSPAADRDLVRLAAFLAENNPRAAAAALDAMTECIQSLREFPDRGWFIARGVRELLVPSGRDGYILRYRVGPTQVVVTRIFHGKERR